jgi:hypothetical protein
MKHPVNKTVVRWIHESSMALSDPVAIAAGTDLITIVIQRGRRSQYRER